jgi:uncharacterized protein (TIGR03086 family)
MTSSAPATELTGGVALLERATGYVLGCLPLVTPDRLANRTPCRGWDMRALLRHLDDSLLALHGAVSAGRVDLEPAEEAGPAANPVTTVRNRARQMIGAWAGTDGPSRVWIADRPLCSEVVAAAGAVEVAVHGWDVSRACGQDRPVPPALAEELLDLSRLLVGEADRPGRFAARVDLGPGYSSPSDRLVAFLGRCP